MNIQMLGYTVNLYGDDAANDADKAAQLQQMFPTVAPETALSIVTTDRVRTEAALASSTPVKEKTSYLMYAALAAGAYMMLK